MTFPESVAPEPEPVAKRVLAVALAAENDVQATRAVTALARACMAHVADARVAAAQTVSHILAEAAAQLSAARSSQGVVNDQDPIRIALYAAAESYLAALQDLTADASGQITLVFDETQQIVSLPIWSTQP